MNAIIYGVGRFAEYATFLLNNDSEFKVHGYCIEKEYLDKETIGDLPVIDFDDVENTFPPDKFQIFIAVGINEERDRLFQLAKLKGYKMLSYISTKAVTWDNLTYGENTWVGEGSIVQPFVSLGDNTILFGARIGHHSKVGDSALLSGTTLGGNVTIGDFTMLGVNSSVKQNTSVGNYNIIGMGCIIEKDTNSNEIYHAGKSTKKRSLTTDIFNDKYLR